MIVSRAPLRISFVGGGTDLPQFYRSQPGRVISTAIDKYVYVAVNRTPLIDKVSARYSMSETVANPSELQHTRIRAALIDAGISKNIEIASFATLPAKTGLGSSSSFSVALVKALSAYQGSKMGPAEVAAAASRLEIDLVGEPIGKQDQYAAAFGGFNVITFNPDETVDVRPVFLDFRQRMAFEDHMLVFFTGMTRDASSVLTEQRANTNKKADVLKAMADQVPVFESRLLAGDLHALGEMLHEGWMMKRGLASTASNAVLDALYDAGLHNGAWGGKVLGAGSGGCLLFLAPPDAHGAIRSAMRAVAEQHALEDYRELPMHFVQSGAEVVFNGDHEGKLQFV